MPMPISMPGRSLNTPVPPSQDLLQRWIQKHADLLGEERAIEQEEAKLLLSKCSPRLLERNGLAILGLGVNSVAVGLGGKTLIELERPAAYHSSPHFPPHSLRPGDIVQIEDNGHDPTQGKQASKGKGKGKGSGDGGNRQGTSAVSGVVYRVSDSKIIVAASSGKQHGSSSTSNDGAGSGMPELPHRVRVVKVANDATFDRMEWGLTRLAKLLHVPVKTAKRSVEASSSDEDDANDSKASGEVSTAGPSSGLGRTDLPFTLVPSLIGRGAPHWEDLPEDVPSRLFNPFLNQSQVSAVKVALASKNFALIHGPPGTGKTTAVAEVVLQMALTQQKRVLVCGASNLAADNLLERIVVKGADVLARSRIGVTRLGHPARVLPSLVETTLDQQAQASSEGGLLRDVRQELESALSSLRPKEAAGNKSASSHGQASAKSQRVRGNERKDRREEIKLLRKEYRKRERTLMRTVLKRAGIVVTTCHGAGARQLDGIDFDVVVIDEACQATEAACWVPVLKAKPNGVLILAGDHLQLPPTVKGFRHSQLSGKAKTGKQGEGLERRTGATGYGHPNGERKASKYADNSDVDDEEENSDQSAGASQAYGASASPKHKTVLRPPRSLETTLFSRLLGIYGPGCKALLDTQYRMNNEIMAFPNDALYEGRIKADDSCATIRLSDVEGYRASDANEEDDDDADAEDSLEAAPLVFYDTAGCEMYESQPSAEEKSGDGERSKGLPPHFDSRGNTHEVDLVFHHVEALVSRGLDPKRISVLSPYNLQVSALSDRLRSSRVKRNVGGGDASVSLESVVVASIDSMQGMENDVVVLSLVRSNDTHSVGFLAEHRRLNVAMTRAKRQLCVVGDSETVGGAGDAYLRKWMEHLEQHALVEPVIPQ